VYRHIFLHLGCNKKQGAGAQIVRKQHGRTCKVSPVCPWLDCNGTFAVSRFQSALPACQFALCFCLHALLLQRESGLGNSVWLKLTFAFFLLQPSTTFSSAFVSASEVPRVSLYWANACARTSDWVSRGWEHDRWQRARIASFW